MDALKVHYLSDIGIEVRKPKCSLKHYYQPLKAIPYPNPDYKSERMRYLLIGALVLIAYLLSYLIPLAILGSLVYLVAVVANVNNILLSIGIGYIGAQLILITHLISSSLLSIPKIPYKTLYRYE